MGIGLFVKVGIHLQLGKFRIGKASQLPEGGYCQFCQFCFIRFQMGLHFLQGGDQTGSGAVCIGVVDTHEVGFFKSKGIVHGHNSCSALFLCAVFLWDGLLFCFSCWTTDFFLPFCFSSACSGWMLSFGPLLMMPLSQIRDNGVNPEESVIPKKSGKRIRRDRFCL